MATARVGGMRAEGLEDVSADPRVLDGAGRWAVAIPYSGQAVLARFARWSPAGSSGPPAATRWHGPDRADWRSSMSRRQYEDAVESVRASIAAGDVYQANVCRILSAALPDPGACAIAGLDALLESGNPAPFGGYLDLPDHGVHVASASPELFVRVEWSEGDRVVTSGPIKGTGRTADDLSDKDRAENIMIVDLVRNDLSIVSITGSVTVPDLLRVEPHPGLVHLVSRVRGILVPGTDWPALLGAAFPPGSVTGAPKGAALGIIAALEPTPREYYCGAFGWVDADSGEAELAVAIRTFWIRAGDLHFGTGAGITWGSRAGAEWAETELKAERLVGVAAGSWQSDTL